MGGMENTFLYILFLPWNPMCVCILDPPAHGALGVRRDGSQGRLGGEGASWFGSILPYGCFAEADFCFSLGRNGRSLHKLVEVIF